MKAIDELFAAPKWTQSLGDLLAKHQSDLGILVAQVDVDRFGLDHLTIQMETPDFEDETFHFCHAGTACFRSARE